MKKQFLILLSILSGLLLSIAWPKDGIAILSLISLIPLLFVEEYFSKETAKPTSFKVISYSYITFIVWNIITTYWIYNATLYGAIAAIVLNSLFMSIAFGIFHICRKSIAKNGSYVILPIIWIAYEFLHLRWELSWPWLTLGNGLANWHYLIQWYEYTGVLGGSLWIILSNIIVFLLIKDIRDKKDFKIIKKRILISILIIFIPIISSLLIYYNYQEENKPVDIVVVQPNIDPYNEKFGGLTDEQQLIKLLNLTNNKIDSETDYLVGPETALVENGINVNSFNTSNSYKIINNLIDSFPNLNVVIGYSPYEIYKDSKLAPITARDFGNKGWKFDVYNSAIQINRDEKFQIYHKSKLVLGVEKLPFPKILKNIESFAIDLGGIVGSLGYQTNRDVFKSISDSINIAPVICYESIYGEYVTDYIKNGAHLIFIMTNDGWWKDTPGYRQHYTFSKIRAIETRRSIARSANTGISCFVNQRGDAFQNTGWWVPAVIKQKLNANNEITFYVKYGDYIGRIALFCSFFFILSTIVYKAINRRKK